MKHPSVWKKALSRRSSGGRFDGEPTFRSLQHLRVPRDADAVCFCVYAVSNCSGRGGLSGGRDATRTRCRAGSRERPRGVRRRRLRERIGGFRRAARVLQDAGGSARLG